MELKTPNRAVEYRFTASGSNEGIVERLRIGDPEAWLATVKQHNQLLFRLARSIVPSDAAAEDVVQETYVKAYLKLSDFRGPLGFRAWLSRIAINEALMQLRRDRNCVDIDDYNASLMFDVSNSKEQTPDGKLMQYELSKVVEAAVDALPNEFRPVFMLRNIQQLSTRETAECLGIPEATVKTRLHRASKLVRTRLSEYINEAEDNAFEFAGKRCARITERVLSRLADLQSRK